MSLSPRTGILLALLLASAPAGWIFPASAQDKPRSWPEEKCARYAKAWSEALRRKGTQGLGDEFLARHDAFLASGCTEPVAVCPRSEAELAMANIMVLASLNAGMGSTFAPFACRK